MGTRRAFLVNAAWLAGSIGLASCAPAAPPAPATSAPAPAQGAAPTAAPAQAAPKPAATSQPASGGQPAAGGQTGSKELLVGSPDEVVDAEPYHQSRGDTYGQVFSSLYDTLLGRDANYKLEPRIATTWKLIENNVWQFNLRKDVKFHNGDPMTAADVKWSIEHTYDPAAKTLYATSFNTISKIDVVDDYTVNVTTKATDPFLPDKLSVRPGYVVPSKYFQSVGDAGMNDKPVGSGPYMFKERVKGVSFTLVKNPNYWRGAPDADSIKWVVRPDVDSRIAALKTGEILIATGLPYDQVDAINANPATKVVTAPDNGVHMYVVNVKVPPLDKKTVRQAMSLALDRPTLIKTLGKGLFQIANGPVGSFEFGYDPSRPPLPYDAAKAKSLLQQAGYANEKIILESTPPRAIQDQAIAEMWKAVGLNIEIQPMDDATRARKVASLGFLGVTWARFASLYGDPDAVIWRTMQPGGTLRYWSDPEFDRLGAEQTSSTDPEVRKRDWAKMEDMMLDEMPWISLWIEPLAWGVSKKIEVTPSYGQSDDYGPGHLKFLA